MKKFTLVIFCICTFSISQAQVNDLLGTWSIVEFTIVNEENTNTKNEVELNKDGSIWDLLFLEDGKLKQTSNMRTGDSESHEGSWQFSEQNLAFKLNVNDRETQLNYEYEVQNKILILKRSNPAGTMKIISKFKKQLN